MKGIIAYSLEIRFYGPTGIWGAIGGSYLYRFKNKGNSGNMDIKSPEKTSA